MLAMVALGWAIAAQHVSSERAGLESRHGADGESAPPASTASTRPWLHGVIPDWVLRAEATAGPTFSRVGWSPGGWLADAHFQFIEGDRSAVRNRSRAERELRRNATRAVSRAERELRRNATRAAMLKKKLSERQRNELRRNATLLRKEQERLRRHQERAAALEKKMQHEREQEAAKRRKERERESTRLQRQAEKRAKLRKWRLPPPAPPTLPPAARLQKKRRRHCASAEVCRPWCANLRSEPWSVKCTWLKTCCGCKACEALPAGGQRPDRVRHTNATRLRRELEEGGAMATAAATLTTLPAGARTRRTSYAIVGRVPMSLAPQT